MCVNSNNTYGVKALPEDVYAETLDAFYRAGGCRDQVLACTNQTVAEREANPAICRSATSFCRSNVEGPYYDYSGRGVYSELFSSLQAPRTVCFSGTDCCLFTTQDIRNPEDDPTPPDFFVDFLNQASTQNALGVNINYTSTSSNSVGRGFQSTGDFVFADFKEDLERIIDRGMATAMVYGDADYICNWFGGQAVSLEMEHETAAQFRAANYTPFVVDGEEFGEVRQYGNFSFVSRNSMLWDLSCLPLSFANLKVTTSYDCTRRGMRHRFTSPRPVWSSSGG